MGIFRVRPTTALPDGSQDATPGRNSGYGERYVLPVGDARQVAGDEGSYYSINTPVLGTDIVGHVAPTLANNDPLPTKSLLHIYNGGDRLITLDFLTLRWVVVNASATATGFLIYTDALASTGRVSGGTLLAPVASRAGVRASSATPYFGAVVTASSPTVQRHFAKYVRAVIAVAGDEAHFAFGNNKSGAQASVALSGAGSAVASYTVQVPPVTIVPGGNFYLCEANPSGAATGATYHFTGGWTEK